MSKADNHIDEIKEIILSKLPKMSAGMMEDRTDYMAEGAEEAAKLIEDFYRNKILEARIDELTDFVETSKGGFRSLADIRASMEVRLDNLTAQFNSRGNNDE